MLPIKNNNIMRLPSKDFSFFFILYIIIIYLYIIVRLIKPKQPNNLILKIIEIACTPFIKLDNKLNIKY